jgi:general stress protein YciG
VKAFIPGRMNKTAQPLYNYFVNLKFKNMEKSRESSDQRNTGTRNNTANRGFASMDPDRQREIASEGGKAAHEKGTAHEFDSDEAREAGRKGGETVSRDREHMSEIGRKGGHSSGNNRRNVGNQNS